MRAAGDYVAIVDDDAAVRTALDRLVSTSSYRVQTYASVREFLQSLKAEMPACLIVDLQMEETTGLELQHLLKSTRTRIPTIILTAHDEPGVQDRCVAAGAVAFLVKPVAKNELIGAIEAAMGRNK